MTHYLPLNSIEKTMTLSNEFAPLVVVTCLQLKKLPGAESVEKALSKLQKRHPLLQAKIIFKGTNIEFEIDEKCHSLSLKTETFSNLSERNDLIEKELNNHFDPKIGGLMRCRILKKTGTFSGEILLVFHHSIIDGVSARLILHEFLSLCSGTELPEPISKKIFFQKRQNLKSLPRFQGFSFFKKLMSFTGRQMKDELLFQIKNRSNQIPKPASDSKNKIISLRFSETETNQIETFSRKSGIGINSLISGAMLKATYEHLYTSRKHFLRVAVFATLRPFVAPRISPKEMGNYTSMLRFTLPVSDETSSVDLGRMLHSQIFAAGKRGDIYLFNFMSSLMIKMILRFKKMRIATTALSYIGVLDLNKKYGNLELESVNAFITNNCFGPQFSGFGKILFGRLVLDYTYLTEETEESVADKISESIRTYLLISSKSGTQL